MFDHTLSFRTFIVSNLKKFARLDCFFMQNLGSCDVSNPVAIQCLVIIVDMLFGCKVFVCRLSIENCSLMDHPFIY